MFRTIDVSLQTDLRELARLLWQHKISHRIIEHENRQLLLIAREEQIPAAMELYKRWQLGEVHFTADKSSSSLSGYFSSGAFVAGVRSAFMLAPLTLLLIAVCIALAFLAPLAEPSRLTFSLLFPDFSYGTRVIVLSRVLDNFTLLQFFKMLSPMLLHGGPLHLVFNMLWLWELGRRIEKLQSSLTLAAAIIVLGLISNTAQYIYGGGNNFGGMSGVVYGLFAYIWMWQLFDPRSALNLPGSLIGFMLLSLVAMTLLQLDMIANEAHLGGFLAGIVYGAAGASISRLRRTMKPKSLD